MPYIIKFYIDSKKKNKPVLDYIEKQDVKNRAKILKFIKHLAENEGYLDEPYSKHIKNKIRELRISFSQNHHRILYFTFVGKTIILLHAFLKKTAKLPGKELAKAEENYLDIINNPNLYE